MLDGLPDPLVETAAVAAESLGCGLGVEARSRPVLGPGEDRFWRRSTAGGGTRLARDWRSIRLGGLLLAGLEDAGYLLFLILAGAVMLPYGHLLDWLLGRFGVLEPRSRSLDMGQGALAFFTPELGLEDLIALALAAAAFGYGLWRQTRPQEVRIDAERVRWRGDDGRGRSIQTREIEGALLIYEPGPALILVGGEACLVIDRIGNALEQDELYAKLLAALADQGVLTQDHLDRLEEEQREQAVSG
jgi:hypothetical protein